jgi:CheY-like chemotaxis protein
MLGQFGRSLKSLRVQQVNRSDIQRGWHRHTCAAIDEALRKLQSRIAMIETAINMSRLNIQQVCRAIYTSHRDQDAHRHLRRISKLTI